MHYILSFIKSILRSLGLHIIDRKVYKPSSEIAYLSMDKDIVNETLLEGSKVTDLRLIEISSKEEFETYSQKNSKAMESRAVLEGVLAERFKGSKEMFGYIGMDKSEGELVKFYSNFGHALTIDNSLVPNFRELSLSSKTWLSARMRGVIHSIDFLSNKFNVDFSQRDVYVSEQVTPFYRYMKKQYPKTVGSEFVSESAEPGSFNSDGVRHEDIQNLSFDNSSIDLIVTMEVLEHVPYYLSAFKSMYNTLRPGGFLVMTVPFDKNIVEHTVMAEMDENGEINYIKNPPEYHGDPMRPDEGALCYRYFGWKTIDELKKVGFTQASTIFMYSYYHGIIGNQDFIVIYARK